MSDWEWWFTSEWGRDRILREQVEGLQASAASAFASGARMRSQLARLEGSLATRLSALSAAFDAYVELGDVREQLLAHVDTGAVRRRVQDAFKTMTEGGRPEPVLDDETDYWLAPATNSVIAINAGGADPQAEATAAARLPEAGLFVVAAAGGLEHGAAVAERVPALFDGVSELDPARRALFSAVTLGVFPGVLPQLEPSVRAAAAGSGELDVTDLRTWVTEQARSPDPQAQLAWIGALLESGAPPPRVGPEGNGSAGEAVAVDLRAPQAVVRDRLRAVVVQMIEAGTGSEAELLRRAKVLRARIESPGQAGSDGEARSDRGGKSDGQGPGEDEMGDPVDERRSPPVRFVVAVRDQLMDPAVGPAEHAVLLAWLRPSLLAVVDELGVTPVRSEPTVTIRTPGGTIDVGPSGTNSGRRTQVLSAISAEEPSERTELYGAAAATGVLAVVALVAALVGQTGLAVLALIVAVAVGVVAVRLGLALATRKREQSDDVARAEQAISDAVRRIQDQQRAERESDDALQQTYQQVRRQLASSESGAAPT